MSESSDLIFKKSSHSAPDECVEVAVRRDEFFVRDSKNQQGPVLRFTAEEWKAFMAGVRAGEFD